MEHCFFLLILPDLEAHTMLKRKIYKIKFKVSKES